MIHRLTTILLATVLGVGCAASSGGGGGGACGAVDPSSCPATVPSYQGEVAAFFTNYCTTCHTAGGSEARILLDSYAAVLRQSANVQSEVGGCGMPPADAPQPTAAERNAVLAWITCGAPNN